MMTVHRCASSEDFVDATSFDDECAATPKKGVRRATHEEDERSTEAGSSDAETSNDESPKSALHQNEKQVGSALTETAWPLPRFFALLGCSRRQRSKGPPSPQGANEKVLCSRCNCCMETSSGEGSASEASAEEEEEEVQTAKEPVPLQQEQEQYSEEEADDEFDVTPPPMFFPPGFGPPPGLPTPPCVEQLMQEHARKMQAASGVAAPLAAASPMPRCFDIVAFHKELVVILRELSSDRNTGKAVQRVREQEVPISEHATEFADILTRAMETRNGMTRRSTIAFAVGLAAGQPSAFDRAKCTEGLGIFFREVYGELREEVPKLTTLVAAELLPTLRLVFSIPQIQGCMPDVVLAQFRQTLRKL